MFLGQIFAKNAKKDPKTLLKRQNRSKNKIRKITVKSQNGFHDKKSKNEKSKDKKSKDNKSKDKKSNG